MALFVHLADARKERALRRSGIIPGARKWRALRGVFAMPVLPNYFTSHQWLRELKRGGARTLVGVYFRTPDGEPVLVGHYNKPHAPLTAAQAARIIRSADDPRGYEVVIPRKIEAREIHAVRPVSQVVGWRYFPGAHGKKVCACPVCVPRGSIKSRKLREEFERAEREPVDPSTAKDEEL